MFKWKRPTTEAPAQPTTDVDDRPLRSVSHGGPGAPASQDAHGVADPRSVAPRQPDDDDVALEAFATALRTFGQYAFDLEHEGAISFSQQCEAWARHLLVLTAPPGCSSSGILDDDAPSVAPGARDWPSVLQFVQTRRQREQHHVNQALGDLRQGMWAFAQSLGSALVEDQRMDNRMKSQIDRLKVVIERPSMADFTKEMMAAANDLSRLVTERQQAQRHRLEELGARVTDLAGQLRDAKQENIRDSLTQLVNRKGFDEFMARMVFMRDVFGESAALLMIDADRFKAINDRHGHSGGDAVLKALADCLVRNFPRKSDLVARYGGEEFAVLLPNVPHTAAKAAADRLRRAIETNPPHTSAGVLLLPPVTVSIGVATMSPNEPAPLQQLIDRADTALASAKAGGRNCIRG